MFAGKLNVDALASINCTSVSTSAIFHADLCPAISRLQCNKEITSVFFARSLRSYVQEPPTIPLKEHFGSIPKRQKRLSSFRNFPVLDPMLFCLSNVNQDHYRGILRCNYTKYILLVFFSKIFGSIYP